MKCPHGQNEQACLECFRSKEATKPHDEPKPRLKKEDSYATSRDREAFAMARLFARMQEIKASSGMSPRAFAVHPESYPGLPHSLNNVPIITSKDLPIGGIYLVYDV